MRTKYVIGYLPTSFKVRKISFDTRLTIRHARKIQYYLQKQKKKNTVHFVYWATREAICKQILNRFNVQWTWIFLTQTCYISIEISYRYIRKNEQFVTVPFTVQPILS